MKLFKEYLKEAISIKNKKWHINPISGYKIEINDTLQHDFTSRIVSIKEYIKSLDKDKHKWILEQTDKDFLKNMENRINSGFKKLSEIYKNIEEPISVTIYFKKSKFIGIYLVKPGYIRLNTIGRYDYLIKNSKKTNINESSIDLIIDK